MESYDLLIRVLPVLILFLTGWLFRKGGFLSSGTVGEIKKLVVNATLPALLFRAFVILEPGKNEVFLAVGMFALGALLLGGSRLADRLSGGRLGILSYSIGGWEAGMLGYALFLSVFGNEALPAFAAVDLGQVLFVFVVLMPFLAKRRHPDKAVSVFKEMAGSPVIWAILGGLLAGIVGRSLNIPVRPFLPIDRFLEIFSGLTVPLIALVVGYELTFERSILGKALAFVVVRKVVMLGVAVLGLVLLPIGVPAVRMAFLTMMILPPPFVLTLGARDEEMGLVSGILSLSTIVSVPLFILAVLITGGTV